MKKILPYIPPALMVVLWFALQKQLGFSSWGLLFGLVGILALSLLGSAWRRGWDPGKPLWQMVLLSIGAIVVPAVGELLYAQWIDYQAIIWALLFLLPIVPACAVGRLTRARCRSARAATLANAAPGIVLLCTLFAIMVILDGGYHKLVWYAKGAVSLSLLIAPVLFSAHAATLQEPGKRRRAFVVSWWLLLLLIELLVVPYAADKEFGLYSYWTYVPALQMALPVLLLRWKGWLRGRLGRRSAVAAAYFLGVYVLTVALAGGLFYAMVGRQVFSLDAEWMLMGTVVALAVWWWRPKRVGAPGIAGSVALVLANAGSLFLLNDRLREVVFDLGGPAVLIFQDAPADWLGYHLDAAGAFVSGDLSAFSDLCAQTGNDVLFRYSWYTSVPFAFPLALAILALSIATAVILARRAGRSSVSVVFAFGVILQAVLFAAEQVTMFINPMAPAFCGVYVTAFVLMKWIMKPEASLAERPGEGLVLPEGKWVYVVSAALLLAVSVGKCQNAVNGWLLYLGMS